MNNQSFFVEWNATKMMNGYMTIANETFCVKEQPNNNCNNKNAHKKTTNNRFLPWEINSGSDDLKHDIYLASWSVIYSYVFWLLERWWGPLLLWLRLRWWCWLLRDLGRSETSLLWRREHCLTGERFRVGTRLHGSMNVLMLSWKWCGWSGCATVANVVVHCRRSLQLLACEVGRGGTRRQGRGSGCYLDWGRQNLSVCRSCWYCGMSLEGRVLLCGLGEVVIRAGVWRREMSEVLEGVGGCSGDGCRSQLVRGVVCCVPCVYGRNRSVYCRISGLVKNTSVRVTCEERKAGAVIFVDSYIPIASWMAMLPRRCWQLVRKVCVSMFTNGT